ncbi:MAG: NUDIX domain-containing protein [Actinobacteria bacterium]|nr:NUDIX domain-containing protein [Actinomycetota bacterium]
MIVAVERILLRLFQVLPPPLRRFIVWSGTPKYTIGAICIVRRDDGAILLVQHSYIDRWGLPGGLVKRREDPDVAAVRETMEEVNLAVELVGSPRVVVEPRRRRVDVVFLARPCRDARLDEVGPTSAEIVETRWFQPEVLPDVSSEAATALAALARDGLLDLSGAGLTPSSGLRTR